MDSLNRLSTAQAGASSFAGAWSEGYTYDGFGNLTDRNVTGGTAPSLHVTVDAATNRLTGYTYDPNGNLTNIPSQAGLSYDVENRVSAVSSVSGGTEQYAYGPDNQRIWKLKADGTEEMYYYDLQGHRLGTYPIYPNPLNQQNGYYLFYIGQGTGNLWFAGRMISNPGQDRLGSVGHYYPYGEAYAGSAPTTEAFATYYRDSSTLDYAQNRYYSSSLGRFTSADPYRASGGPADPGSWNRYAYVGNDPVNFNDPAGLQACLGDGEDQYRFGGAGCGGYGNGDSTPQRPKSDSDRPNRGAGGPGTLYNILAALLKELARQFAKNLLIENIPTDCAGDLSKLGITPEQWAGALNKVSVLNGIGSSVPLASTLPAGSDEQKTAQSRNLTVGGQFSPTSGTVALASVNGPQVWINPFLVNPGDSLGDSALIAHETLHNLGLVDTTIQIRLGIPVTPITKNIADKLQVDCFPGYSGPTTLP